MKVVLMLLFKDIHYDARVMREATALADNGWKVVIGCLEVYGEPPPLKHDNIELVRIELTTKRVKRRVDGEGTGRHKAWVYRLVRHPVVKLAKDVLAQREFKNKLVQALAHTDVHVVHCHDLNTLNTGVALKRRLNIPHLVYDSHELFNEMNGKRPLERVIGYWMEGKYIRSADAIITVNEYLKAELEKRYRIDGVVVVRNVQPLAESVDAAEERVKRRYFHQMYGLPPSAKVVLYQGGFTPSRGLEELIAAVKYLPEDVHVVLLGYGDLKEQLVERVKRLGLERNVHFHGSVLPHRLPALTREADVGVVLYKNTCRNNYLSTPNKIFEYMQAEIPVVSSDHPGKAIVVKQAGTGVLVDPDRPACIAEGIVSALRDAAQYRDRARVAKRTFCWEREQQVLLQLYSRLG